MVTKSNAQCLDTYTKKKKKHQQKVELIIFIIRKK